MDVKRSVLLIESDPQKRARFTAQFKTVLPLLHVLEVESYSVGLKKADFQKFDTIIVGQSDERTDQATAVAHLKMINEEFVPSFIFVLLSEDRFTFSEPVPTTRVHYYQWPNQESACLTDLVAILDPEGAKAFLSPQKAKELKQRILSAFFEHATQVIQEDLGAELKREDLKIRTAEDLCGEISVVKEFRTRNLVGSLGVGFRREFIDTLAQAEHGLATLTEYEKIASNLVEKVRVELQAQCLIHEIALNCFASATRISHGHLISHFVQSNIMCLKLRAGDFKSQIEIGFKEFTG